MRLPTNLSLSHATTLACHDCGCWGLHFNRLAQPWRMIACDVHLLQMAAQTAAGVHSWQELGEKYKLRVVGKWIDPDVDLVVGTENR